MARDTARWVNAHPIGVAILQAPFFLVGHALTRWTNLSPDGFTLYYQHAAGLAGPAGPWPACRSSPTAPATIQRWRDRRNACRAAPWHEPLPLRHLSTARTATPIRSFCLRRSSVADGPLVPRSRTHERARHVFDRCLLGVVAGLIVLTRHTNALFVLVLPLCTASRPAPPLRAVRRATLGAMAGSGDHGARRQRRCCCRSWRSTIEATGRIFVSSYGDLGLHFPVAASLGSALQRAEGAVLLVAASAGCRRRLHCW